MAHGHVPHLHHEIEEGVAHDWLEIIAAVLLALATVASAWSAYQSATWGGLEAEKFAEANTNRIHSSVAKEAADQHHTCDVAVFSDFVYAYADGNTELTEFYQTHLFSEELKEAMEAWFATSPFSNPDAPRSPFEMSEYHNAESDKYRELEKEAAEATDEARLAVVQADRYVLFTVLFAAVLFFAGISTKFGNKRVRTSVLIMGIVLFVLTTVMVLLQPLHIS